MSSSNTYSVFNKWGDNMKVIECYDMDKYAVMYDEKYNVIRIVEK